MKGIMTVFSLLVLLAMPFGLAGSGKSIDTTLDTTSIDTTETSAVGSTPDTAITEIKTTDSIEKKPIETEKKYKKYQHRKQPRTSLTYGGFHRVDINRDGVVDQRDLGILLSQYGARNCGVENAWCRDADIDQDGNVNNRDLYLVLAFYGKFP